MKEKTKLNIGLLNVSLGTLLSKEIFSDMI